MTTTLGNRDSVSSVSAGASAASGSAIRSGAVTAARDLTAGTGTAVIVCAVSL